MACGNKNDFEGFLNGYQTAVEGEELRLNQIFADSGGDTVDEEYFGGELLPQADLDQHLRRNGTTYPKGSPRAISTNSSITPTNQIASMPNPNDPPTTPTLKVLPAEVSVRRYTGEDEDYSARAYLRACEDVMRQAGTTGAADKISFIRSHVASNSRAELLLGSALLTRKVIGDDYNKFVKHFLSVFGGGVETTILKQINHVVDQVASQFGSLNIWEGTVPANYLSDGFMTCLKEGKWFDTTDDKITYDQMDKIMQLVFYMFCTRSQVREAAVELDFKPSGELVDLIPKIETKLRRQGGTGNAVAASIPTSDVLGPSYAATVAKKQTVTCDYCHKVGHPAKKCLKRKKEQRYNTSTKDDWTSQTTSRGAGPSVRPKTTPKPTNVADASDRASSLRSYYCWLHGHHATHSTDRCYGLQKLREEHERKRFPGGKPSGEASRPGGQNPG